MRLPAATLILSVFVGFYIEMPFEAGSFGAWFRARSDANGSSGRPRPPGNEFLCNRCVHRFAMPGHIQTARKHRNRPTTRVRSAVDSRQRPLTFAVVTKQSGHAPQFENAAPSHGIRIRIHIRAVFPNSPDGQAHRRRRGRRGGRAVALDPRGIAIRPDTA